MHIAILVGALISFQSRRDTHMPEPEQVAVGMISPSEVTKVRLGSETAKPTAVAPNDSTKGDIAKKQSPKTKLAAAAPPPPPPPPPEQKADPTPPAAPATPAKLAAPPPAPSPPSAVPPEVLKKLEADEAAEKAKAEEQRKAEEQKKRAEEQKRQAEIKKQAELKRRAEIKKRLEEKRRKLAELKRKQEEERKRQEAEAARKKQFNGDKIAALLNTIPNSAAPPPPSDAPDAKAKGPSLGSAEGRDKQISASAIAMLKGRIKSRLKTCWRLPSGGGGSDTPAVTLVWRLKMDGSLDGDPQVQSPRGDALFQLAAENAQRAVRECAPFDLPPEMYAAWREIEWDFDPSKML
jgi:colicin import membrane protein